jgi:hypothetical protein
MDARHHRRDLVIRRQNKEVGEAATQRLKQVYIAHQRLAGTLALALIAGLATYILAYEFLLNALDSTVASWFKAGTFSNETLGFIAMMILQGLVFAVVGTCLVAPIHDQKVIWATLLALAGTLMVTIIPGVVLMLGYGHGFQWTLDSMFAAPVDAATRVLKNTALLLAWEAAWFAGLGVLADLGLKVKA